MAFKLLDTEATSSHREATGADGLGAGDVLWRITDDPCLICSKRSARMSFGALQRDGTELVAVGMITTISAKGKIVR